MANLTRTLTNTFGMENVDGKKVLLGFNNHTDYRYSESNYVIKQNSANNYNHEEGVILKNTILAVDRYHKLTVKNAMRLKSKISPINLYYVKMDGKVIPITHRIKGNKMINIATKEVISLDLKGNPYFYEVTTWESNKFEIKYSSKRGYSITAPIYAIIEEDIVSFGQINDCDEDFNIQNVGDGLGVIGRMQLSVEAMKEPVIKTGVVVKSDNSNEKMLKIWTPSTFDNQELSHPAELTEIQHLPIGQVVRIKSFYENGKLNTTILDLLSANYW